MVSQKLQDELKNILEEDYGRTLSSAEIEEIANNPVDYFKLLNKIDHRQQIEINTQ